MEQSSYDIGLLCDKKEQELREAINSQSTVQQEILLLSRQIIDLQGKKKDFEISLSKATHNRQIIASELRELKNKFFAARNSGL